MQWYPLDRDMHVCIDMFKSGELRPEQYPRGDEGPPSQMQQMQQMQRRHFLSCVQILVIEVTRRLSWCVQLVSQVLQY